MTYNFTLTPRLMFVAAASLVALLLLLFFTGIEIGRQLATPDAAPGLIATALPASPPSLPSPPPALPADPVPAAAPAH